MPRAQPTLKDHTFESADAGASHTYPQQAKLQTLSHSGTRGRKVTRDFFILSLQWQAGEVRKGSHLMIKGRPCKCLDFTGLFGFPAAEA